jgi:hypothetical protein
MTRRTTGALNLSIVLICYHSRLRGGRHTVGYLRNSELLSLGRRYTLKLYDYGVQRSESLRLWTVSIGRNSRLLDSTTFRKRDVSV